MTTRTAEVETEKVVTETREVTVCDGCGREVDETASDVDVWDKQNSDEKIHVGPNCNVEDLTRQTGTISSLRARVNFGTLTKSLPKPASGIGTATGLVMAGIPLALHFGAPANLFSAAFMSLLLVVWGGAAFMGLVGVEEGTEGDKFGAEGLLIPLFTLLAVLAAPISLNLGIALVVSSLAIQFAYYMARYSMTPE